MINPNDEYSFLITNGTTSKLLHCIDSAISKHRKLYKIIEEDNLWIQQWEIWRQQKNIHRCQTLRSVATILYGNYDRKTHDVQFIIDTLRTEIPILDEYYQFTTIGDFGDIRISPNEIKLHNYDDVTIHDVYVFYEAQRLMVLITNVVDAWISKHSEETPPWLNTWKQYKEDGIEQCELLFEMRQIVAPDIQSATFAELIDIMRLNIPLLNELFRIEEFNEDIIIVQ